jgi:hypothetical protein
MWSPYDQVEHQGKKEEMWRKKEEGKVEEVDEELKENQILQKMVFQLSFEAVLAVMLLIGEVIKMEMKNLTHERN